MGVGVGVGVAVGATVGDGVTVGMGTGATVTAGVRVGSASASHPINDSARMKKSAAKKMVWAKVRGFTTGCCSKQPKTQPF